MANYNTHSTKQAFIFRSWLLTSVGEKLQLDSTYAKVAKKASKELGFVCTSSQTARASKDIGIEPRFARGQGASSLKPRVEALEASVEGLLLAVEELTNIATRADNRDHGGM